MTNQLEILKSFLICYKEVLEESTMVVGWDAFEMQCIKLFDEQDWTPGQANIIIFIDTKIMKEAIKYEAFLEGEI